MREAPNWFRLKRELWRQRAVNQRSQVSFEQCDRLRGVAISALNKHRLHRRTIADHDEQPAVRSQRIDKALIQELH